MEISKVRIKNFKGINDWKEFELKPITVFIGPNSSGKSSVIHALAALSQTFKLPNDTRPLVLDDEHADVHLGRFIEVAHTRSYDDFIGIELDLTELEIPELVTKKKPRMRKVDIKVSLQFKSRLRTQDIYLEKACYRINEHEYVVEKKLRGYHLIIDGEVIGKNFGVNRIFLDNASLFRFRPDQQPQEFFTIYFAQEQISERLQNISYLGPFRQSPKRRYPTRGASPTEVGPEGEAAITMLANEVVQSKRRTNLNQISKWMGNMGIGKKISVQRLSGSDLFDARIQLEDGEKFSMADLGYGVSQVLPVLTQCSFSKLGDILLFEQPELHLHTMPSRHLAGIFAEVSKAKNLKIVAETHSPDFFKRFISEMRNGTLDPDDFVAYRVTREGKESCFTKLEVDDDGEIYHNWEKGLSIPT